MVFRVFLLQKLETLKRFKVDGDRFLAHNLYWVFLPRDAMLARYLLALCLSVCLSVCLSQVGVLLKRLNTGLHKQHHTIAQGYYFSDAKDRSEIPPGSAHTGTPNAGWMGSLSTNNSLYLENGTKQTHDFNKHGASRGPSATADLFVIVQLNSRYT